MTIILFLYLALFPLLISKLFNDSKISKKVFLFICFVQLFFFYAFRSFEVGTDTLSYINTFNGFESQITYKYSFLHYEIGFQLIYEMLKYFNAGSQWVLIVSGCIIHFSIGVFIYKNSKNIALSTFLYTCLCFPNSMNIIRQYIALSIAIHFIYFLLKDKYFFSIMFILIGSLFHQIALIFLFFVIIYKIKMPRLVVSIFFIVFISAIIFPNMYLSYLTTIYDSNNYLSNDNFAVFRTFRLTNLITIIQILLFGYNFYKKSYKCRNDELFFYFSLLNLIVGILYLKNEIFSRIYEFLNVYLLIGIPQVKESLKCYYKPVINVLMYTIPLMILLLAVTNSGGGVENYSMIFFK